VGTVHLGRAPRIDLRSRVRSGWLPSSKLLGRWAGAALGRKAAGREISVLIVGPADSRRLNHAWRGKDSPTNVLSFPVADAAVTGAHAAAGAVPRAGAKATRSSAVPRGWLGDLVICPQVLRREAAEQQKNPRAHWAHLVVHGVLHLVGYDHEVPRDAKRMERREIRVLRGLGIMNPYRSAREA
jgi:probable rRNA maturation factor